MAVMLDDCQVERKLQKPWGTKCLKLVTEVRRWLLDILVPGLEENLGQGAD